MLRFSNKTLLNTNGTMNFRNTVLKNFLPCGNEQARYFFHDVQKQGNMLHGLQQKYSDDSSRMKNQVGGFQQSN